jgi:hypothetical protein
LGPRRAGAAAVVPLGAPTTELGACAAKGMEPAKIKVATIAADIVDPISHSFTYDVLVWGRSRSQYMALNAASASDKFTVHVLRHESETSSLLHDSVE